MFNTPKSGPFAAPYSSRQDNRSAEQKARDAETDGQPWEVRDVDDGCLIRGAAGILDHEVTSLYGYGFRRVRGADIHISHPAAKVVADLQAATINARKFGQ